MIEYIAANYIWILAGLITLLLIIIGYYADKTNFGQNNDVEEEPNVIDDTNDESEVINPTEISQDQNVPQDNQMDLIEMQPALETSVEEPTKEIETPIVEESIATEEAEESAQTIESPVIEEPKELENTIEQPKEEPEKVDSFEQYEEEINELLPEKDIMSIQADDLLTDINNLSLDKTQKLNLSDIPDLDDVDLPRIKKLQKEDEDIWNI